MHHLSETASLVSAEPSHSWDEQGPEISSQLASPDGLSSQKTLQTPAQFTEIPKIDQLDERDNRGPLAENTTTRTEATDQRAYTSPLAPPLTMPSRVGATYVPHQNTGPVQRFASVSPGLHKRDILGLPLNINNSEKSPRSSTSRSLFGVVITRRPPQKSPTVVAKFKTSKAIKSNERADNLNNHGLAFHSTNVKGPQLKRVYSVSPLHGAPLPLLDRSTGPSRLTDEDKDRMSPNRTKENDFSRETESEGPKPNSRGTDSPPNSSISYETTSPDLSGSSLSSAGSNLKSPGNVTISHPVPLSAIDKTSHHQTTVDGSIQSEIRSRRIIERAIGVVLPGKTQRERQETASLAEVLTSVFSKNAHQEETLTNHAKSARSYVAEKQDGTSSASEDRYAPIYPKHPRDFKTYEHKTRTLDHGEAAEELFDTRMADVCFEKNTATRVNKIVMKSNLRHSTGEYQVGYTEPISSKFAKFELSREEWFLNALESFFGPEGQTGAGPKPKQDGSESGDRYYSDSDGETEADAYHVRLGKRRNLDDIHRYPTAKNQRIKVIHSVADDTGNDINSGVDESIVISWRITLRQLIKGKAKNDSAYMISLGDVLRSIHEAKDLIDFEMIVDTGLWLSILQVSELMVEDATFSEESDILGLAKGIAEYWGQKWTSSVMSG